MPTTRAGFELPPQHQVNADPYVTGLRRGLGIEDDCQGDTVIETLRKHWEQADELDARVQVLEVYYGDRLSFEDLVPLGGLFMILTQGDPFDSFISAATESHPFLQADRAALKTGQE